MNPIFAELERHLNEVRRLASQLQGANGNGHISPPEEGPLAQRLRAAEQRANQAEVKVSKLVQEMERVRREAADSGKVVQRLAFQDPLTGLANLNLIEQHIETALQNLPATQGAALLLVDLDRFKVINDAMGLKAGNELLVRLSDRLQRVVGDGGAVGRRGEDEFLIFLSRVPLDQLESIAQAAARQVLKVVSEPFTILGQKLEVTASIGIGLYNGGEKSAVDLVSRADSALYKAKADGRARFELHTPTLQRKQQRSLTLEYQLRHALEANELFLEYLPVIWLEAQKNGQLEGRMVGVEALVRWNHRIEGILPPSEFIPVAEASGQMVAIGRWVIHQVCQQIRAWLAADIRLFATVNLSPRQLLQADLVETVIEEVSAAGVPPGQLSFDITEDFASLNVERIDQTIARLERAGLAIAIDNFGDGFSSLSRLARARFLKISPKLVRQASELCQHAIAIASSLGLIAVGVGVEDQQAARFLVERGCAMAQGYYFSKPISAQEVTELAASAHRWTA